MDGGSYDSRILEGRCLVFARISSFSALTFIFYSLRYLSKTAFSSTYLSISHLEQSKSYYCEQGMEGCGTCYDYLIFLSFLMHLDYVYDHTAFL